MKSSFQTALKNQTEEICRLAVQQRGHALKYAHEQTEEICKIAVQQDGYTLQYVHNQTEEICKLAVRQNGCAFQFINKVGGHNGKRKVSA